jgi:hypothetical protein
MRLSTSIAAVLAALSVGALAVTAERAPWRLVQAGDGSLHVIADGVRHRIAPAPIAARRRAWAAAQERLDEMEAWCRSVAANLSAMT